MLCKDGKLYLPEAAATCTSGVFEWSPNIERLPITGAAIGIEKGLVDKGCFSDGTAFSFILPDPTPFVMNEEGYLEGVFDSLPVAN
jgi:hypothetical protein